MSAVDLALARRYLLGEASESEKSALEQHCLEEADALDEVAAAEEELIEDYLENRLNPSARDRFERHYLAAPRHRVRVETVRNLVGLAANSAPPGWPDTPRSSMRAARIGVRRLPLVAAAALVIVAAGTLWLWRYRASSEQSPAPSRAEVSPPSSAARPSGPQSPPPSPRVFAFSLAPLRVRGGGDRPSLVIPDGTEIVALDLERGDSDARLDRARGVIRTLSSQEVWSGAASTGTLPAGIAARLEVPTGRLPADDYTITLISVDPSGREREAYVYFLRVSGR